MNTTFRRIGASLIAVVPLLSFSIGMTSAQEGSTICFGFQDLETEFWVAGQVVLVLSDIVSREVVGGLRFCCVVVVVGVGMVFVVCCGIYVGVVGVV